MNAAIRRRTAWRNGTATAALLIALGPLALSAAVVTTSRAAWAAPAPVRAHAHPQFGRMVFDWAISVDFNARVEGERLLITFSQPIETQVAAAVGALPQYLSGGRVEPDGRTVAFDLKRPVTLKTFRSGAKVAVDLAFAPDAASNSAAPPAPVPAAPAAAPPPPAPAVPPPASAASPIPPARVPSAPGLKVAVRGADHPDHTRLVFDWPEDAGYALQRDGQGVTLLFNKAAAAQLPKAALRNVRNLESFPQANGALAVTFAAPIDSDVRDFKNGRSLVVDVRNPGTRPLPPPAAAAAPAAPIAAAAPTPALPLPPGATTTAVRGSPATPATTAAPPPNGAVNGKTPPPGPPPAAGRQDAAALPPPPAAPTPAPLPPPDPAAANGVTAPAAVRDGLTLTFDAGGPASMAAFARGGFFYVVFDRPMPIGAGVASGEQKELLGAIEPVPATGGSVYRTRVGPLLWPKIERKGTVWVITPSTRLATAPPEELSVLPQPEFLLGARLLVRAADPGAAVQFTDPDVGDRLQVAPLPAPSFAVTRPHRYPDLEIVPSFHGVVVRPITDMVTVRSVKEGVEISAAGGLRLSSAEDTGGPAAVAAFNAAESKGGSGGQGGSGQTAGPAAGFAQREPAPLFPDQSGAKGKRLFDFPAWQQGGPEHYTEARQKLQLAVAEATDEDRPRAVLDLARFYLAYGMGQEATGLLGLLSAQQPDLEAWPEFRALRGVGRYLSGDFAGALDDLSVAGLADNTEAGLWRAAAAAGRRDWSVAAAGFRSGGGILATYPDPLLTRLSTEAADAFLRAGQPDFAQSLLDRLMARIGSEADSVPMMQYLRGEVARLREDHELANEMLNAAYGSLDRLVRAKAGLALTNLERAENRISTEGAVDRLAGLTFIWRGDELEMDIRQRLGEIYVESGQFANGFNSLKETAAMQPDSPRSAAIAAFMQRTFAELFKDGGTKLPVLEAMQFYDQYRELTPVGEEGDEVIRQLAERLAAIDLLARASDLYEHQVRFRLAGLDKARAGTRLASLRLLDNKPEDAIRALELSNIGGLPADLEAERRTMHAKALAELGREQEALQLLARDDSRPADLLRVDIAWRAQKWEQAAIALSKVIGRPPGNGKPLDPATSQLVLNRAVALALAGDGTGLNTMRKDFGVAMAAGPDADAFRVLTRPEQATGLIDVDTIRSRVAEVDVFQNFLKGYRSRIGQPAAPGGPAPKPGPAPNS